MATSRCVTDFSICESCCWGCISSVVSGCCLVLGAERERESEGEPMLLHVHSWAHGVKTPETSGQKTTPLSCCRVGVAQVCGVNSRVKGRTGSAKARRHSIPGSSVGDHVGCTDV